MSNNIILGSLRSILWEAEACNLLKKILRHRYFPVSFAKFFRAPLFMERIRETASCLCGEDIQYINLLFSSAYLGPCQIFMMSLYLGKQ